MPALLLLTDYFWQSRRDSQESACLYGLLAIGGAAGAAFVVGDPADDATRPDSACADFTPVTYFFTQCRVIWIYVRMFFLPFGQNIDPDVPDFASALRSRRDLRTCWRWSAVVAAAWIYRKRWPLASFGVFVFLLLLAPTSSFVPIRDVLGRAAHVPSVSRAGSGVPGSSCAGSKLANAGWVGAAAVLVCYSC